MKKIKLYVEVADTRYKQQMGLKNRKRMPKNSGMLFCFDYPYKLSFWMMDTYIPLDIAFLDEDGVVLQIEEMIPMSTRPVKCQHECRHALEVNRGWFKGNGIQIGDKIRGMCFDKTDRFAQVNLDELLADVEGDIEQEQVEQEINPVVVIEKSIKDRLIEANMRHESGVPADLYVVYRKKDGYLLPPKLISPPFRFEPDSEGNVDSIVKAWDNQTAGWKSFLIDNIESLQEKPD